MRETEFFNSLRFNFRLSRALICATAGIVLGVLIAPANIAYAEGVSGLTLRHSKDAHGLVNSDNSYGLCSLEGKYALAEGLSPGQTFTDYSTNIEYKVVTEATTSNNGTVIISNAVASPVTSLVFDTVSNTGNTYNIIGVGHSAFKGNTTIQSVEFMRELSVTDYTEEASSLFKYAVGSNAFNSCTALTSVTFYGKTLDGIGTQSFSGCTSLSNVSFEDGLTIGGFGIGEYAFRECKSLTYLKIPAITRATPAGNYYRAYGTSARGTAMSGYQGHWHDSFFAIDKSAIFPNAFFRSGLETLVFEAGNSTGMFAYTDSQGCGLRYLSTLKNVVYEAAQPYYGNPNRSLANASFVSVWGLTGDETEGVEAADPTFYYAVDYYYTEESANADNAYRNNRIARVEYEANTPTDALKSGTGLDNYTYAKPSDYTQTTRDGVSPNPQEAALEAKAAGVSGFEDAEQHTWTWKLTDTQSRRSGLTDSCRAYLVRSDNISAGRFEYDKDRTNVIDTLYRVCDQNLSEGSTQDCAFDVDRYYAGDSVYLMGGSSVESILAELDSKEGRSTTSSNWITVYENTLSTLSSRFYIYDAKGTKIDLGNSNEFDISYGVYDTETKSITKIEKIPSGNNPILLTITPKNGNSYGLDPTTYLQEWLLVCSQTGSVQTQYSESAVTTYHNAIYYSGEGASESVTLSTDKSAGYLVGMSSGDLESALLASSYAGLVHGGVSIPNVKQSDGSSVPLSDEDYGICFALPGNYTQHANIEDVSKVKRMSSKDYDSATEASQQMFSNFNENFEIDSQYQWSENTIVLVNPSYLTECASAAASYSYAKKAPIFYTNDDGSIDSTLKTTLSKYSNIVIVGDNSMIPQSAVSPLNATITRFDGSACGINVCSNACTMSIAAAKAIIADNSLSNTLGTIAINIQSGSDATLDAVSVQNFAGHESGISLAVSSTSDAKAVAQFVLDNKISLERIRLFGRSGDTADSKSFYFLDTLNQILNSTEKQSIASPDTSDTYEINGVMFTADSNKILHPLSTNARIWGTADVQAGDYTFGYDASGNTISYTLKETYHDAVKPDPDPEPDPDPDPDPTPDPSPTPTPTNPTNNSSTSNSTSYTSQNLAAISSSALTPNTSSQTIASSSQQSPNTLAKNELSSDWTLFDAPGITEDGSDTTQTAQEFPALPASVVALCCASCAGSIYYSSRSRKDTDDVLPSNPVSETKK